jgi:hypothetical protein
MIFAESLDEDRPMINIAWYSDNGEFGGLPDVWLEAISHWMPLPGPPDV